MKERIDIKMAGTGSSRNSSPVNGSLEVLRMQMDIDSMSRQSAMMIKFTDESITALKLAQKTRQPVLLKIDKQVYHLCHISHISYIIKML